MDFRLGMWNILTLYRPGGLQVLLSELDKYRLDITAIQEIRWTGHGLLEKKFHTIYYSGHDRNHIFGTGFVVRGWMRQRVIGFNPINDRLCSIRIKGTFYNYTLFSCHAPTEASSDDEKDAYYDALERAFDACSRSDIKILLGDFNAKIGREDAYKPTIGSFSLHEESNENGKRVIDFAASRNLVVGSTLFPGRRIYKATWKSPDGVTHNQIDHILISSRHKSNLLSSRTYRGANVDSDHYLVISKIRARIATVRNHRTERPKRWNIGKLKDPESCQAFQQKTEELVKDGLRVADVRNVQDVWDQLEKALDGAAEQILGREALEDRGKWFDDECKLANDAKNEAYRKMLNKRFTRRATEEYRNKRRLEKKLLRNKKRAWERRELEDIEAHWTVKESRKFFQMVNSGRAVFKPRIQSCKKEDGTLLTNKPDILDRWARHFQLLLNEEVVVEDIEAADIAGENIPNDLLGDIEPPDFEEVMDAILRMKNNKAPGLDGLPAELFKYGGDEFHKALSDIVLTIWDQERVPRQWANSIICPLHKKGDQLDCTNYRGISLLSCAYKILSNVLFSRLAPYAEREIGKYQAGFRRGRSTVDQVFTLRTILERGHEYKIHTHHLFVDFKSAYDSIKRPKLYEALREMGIPRKLIRLVKLTMKDVRCQVRIQSDCSDVFTSNKGLRQGDGLACLLFNLALEKAVRDSGIQTTHTIFTRTVQILGYADDLDIVARTRSALVEAFGKLMDAASAMGLAINDRKTKYMYTGNDGEEALIVGPYRFQRVNEFTYLGSLVTPINDVSAEIRKRLVAANRAYFALLKTLRSRSITRGTKLVIYKTLIRPVLTYASQTWTISRQNENSLLIFERKILRRIVGPVRDGDGWRIRRNREIYERYGDMDIVKFIRLGRLSWAGHVARMEVEEIPRRVVDTALHSTRRTGRPRLRWVDGVAADARSLLRIRSWRAAAQNRAEWRRLIEEARTHQGL